MAARCCRFGKPLHRLSARSFFTRNDGAGFRARDGEDELQNPRDLRRASILHMKGSPCFLPIHKPLSLLSRGKRRKWQLALPHECISRLSLLWGGKERNHVDARRWCILTLDAGVRFADRFLEGARAIRTDRCAGVCACSFARHALSERVMRTATRNVLQFDRSWILIVVLFGSC